MSIPADIPQRPSLPDYELLKPIGRGSYGDVWLARGVTGVFRAVKVVWRSRFPEDRPYLREFEGVTRFASISLREPSQLALLHAGRSDDAGFFYYVMELADDAERGRTIEPEHYVPLTLRELRKRRGQLPIAEVVALSVALCRALASLHAASLVHRDIKPSNVVLVGGVPKLADVGLVAAVSEGLTFVGTEGFVPPEGPGAPTADVYSLGKVIYELATGLDRNEYPRMPPDLGTRPDRKELLELNEVILRACDPRPDKRYRDAAALLDELLLLQAGKSVRRLRAAERSVGRALRLAAALALVAAVAGGGAWIENRRAAEAEAQRDALWKRTEYLARISQARLALDRRDYNGARRLLAEVVPKEGEVDLRGVEWGILRQQAKGDPAIVVRSEGAAILALKQSPADRLYAVHDKSRTLTLYHTDTHKVVRAINGVQQFAGFSSDGTWLVGTTVDPMSTAQRWSVADGSAESVRKRSLRMRPLGTRGSDEVIGFVDARPASPKVRVPTAPEVIVWNFTKQEPTWRRSLPEPGDERSWTFFRGAVDAHGERVAVALLHGQGPNAQFNLSVTPISEDAKVQSMYTTDFLPTFFRFWAREPLGGLYAADSVKRAARIFDPGSAKWIDQSSEVGRWDQRFDWSKANLEIRTRGSEVLVLPASGDAAHGRRFYGHGGAIEEVLPLGRETFVTASNSGEIIAWSLSQKTSAYKERRIWNSHGRDNRMVMSLESEWLFATLEDGVVGALSVRSLEPEFRIDEMFAPISCIGDVLWGVGKDRLRVIAWHLKEKRIVAESVPVAFPIADVALSIAGTRVAFLCSDGTLYFWDRDRGNTPSPCVEKPNIAWSMQMDAEGQRLWFVDNGPRIKCLSLPGGERVWEVGLPGLPSTMKLDAAGDFLAVALENGEVEVRNSSDGSRRAAIASGKNSVQSLFLTKPPVRLIATDRSASTHILDPDFGALATIDDQRTDSAVTSVLSPDGRYLALVGKTGQLRVIDFQ